MTVGDIEAYSIIRHMGLSHEEFLRSLPAAVAQMDCRVDGPRIRVFDSEKRIEIRLEPERKRRLGSLVLPQTEVVLNFEGFATEERERFMKRFDLAFQRGGG